VARKRKSRSAKSKQQERRPCRASRRTNADWFRRLQNWLLPSDGIFAELKLHGNTGWMPRALVWLALFWSWSASPHVTDGFTQAMEWRQLSAGSLAVTTYQGFMKAIVRWTDRLLSVLWSVLHARMQEIAGNNWRVHDWLPIAFDGSRATAPRSKSNENALCAPNYGHGQTARYRRKKSKGMRRTKNERNPAKPQEPQVWMTILWHMSLRLHWRWKLGPSNSSERAHVMEMIDDGEFPENTLFCGDAGFVGYPLWTAIVERGLHFLVRVGANVQLPEREDGLSGSPPRRHRLLLASDGATGEAAPITSQIGESSNRKATDVDADECSATEAVDPQTDRHVLQNALGNRGRLSRSQTDARLRHAPLPQQPKAHGRTELVHHGDGGRRVIRAQRTAGPSGQTESRARSQKAQLGKHDACAAQLPDSPERRSATGRGPPITTASRGHRPLRAQILQAAPLPAAKPR